MNKPVVLIVDNHLEFLATRSELVEAAGFSVLTAQTPEEARNLVNNDKHKIELAVVDLRLHNDDDPDDKTGFFLAEELHTLIPVILYTDFANVATTRAALRPNEHGESIALDYVCKTDGSGALITSIKESLAARKPVESRSWKNSKTWKTVRKIALAMTVIAIIVLIVFGSKSDRSGAIALSILAGLQIMYPVISDIFKKT
jgi:DNA-binding NtrC family response regulator